jgi:aconitate hydratase
MPDGAVIIAAITSCTNTSNPRNVIAAGLLARNANAGPDAQAVGQVVAGAGLEGRAAVPGRSRPAAGTGKARLRHRRLRLHHLQRHVGALDPVIQQEIIDRDLYATAVLSGNRNFDGRIHPYAKQVPGLAAAGGGLRHRRHHALRHREGRAGRRRTARKSA